MRRLGPAVDHTAAGRRSYQQDVVDSPARADVDALDLERVDVVLAAQLA